MQFFLRGGTIEFGVVDRDQTQVRISLGDTSTGEISNEEAAG
jgi:hypothetical protein